MATVSVLNADSGLSGKTLLTLEGDFSITGLHTYSRSPSAPFAVTASSAMVTNLDAQKLNSQLAAYYTDLAKWTQVTITATGTQNNYAPGFTANQPLMVICNNASLLTITGVAGGAAGQLLLFVGSNSQVDFAHNSGSSSAGNKFTNIATSGNTSITNKGHALYQYGASGWLLVSHDQGSWITPTFAAGNFTASGSMTWTVGAGAVTTMKYKLSGHTITVAWSIGATTTGGTASTQLLIGNGQWGSFTATAQMVNAAGLLIDNSVRTTGYVIVTAAGTTIANNRTDNANWVLSAGTQTFAEITFEVD